MRSTSIMQHKWLLQGVWQLACICVLAVEAQLTPGCSVARRSCSRRRGSAGRESGEG
jgi:hypothetical protein